MPKSESQRLNLNYTGIVLLILSCISAIYSRSHFFHNKKLFYSLTAAELIVAIAGVMLIATNRSTNAVVLNNRMLLKIFLAGFIISLVSSLCLSLIHS